MKNTLYIIQMKVENYCEIIDSEKKGKKMIRKYSAINIMNNLDNVYNTNNISKLYYNKW